MASQKEPTEPFVFWLIRQFLSAEEDPMRDLRPVGDKEFYSILTILLVGVVILALTIGPFAIR